MRRASGPLQLWASADRNHAALEHQYSLYIPSYTINSCSYLSHAQRLSPELNQELTKFILPLVREIPPSTGATYWSARLWEIALLTDIVPARLPEAAAAARKLYVENGPADPIKLATLRLWLNASAAANDEEPVKIATALLLDTKPVAQRAELVASLSDALAARSRNDANIALLLRETNHPDVVAQTSLLSNLKTRLGRLQRDATQATAFTRELKDWLRTHDFAYFETMPPLTLDQPRYASPNQEGIYAGNILPHAEQAKCNLLLALDETKAMSVRYRAFAAFYFTVGSREASCDRLVPIAASAINLSSLPDEPAFEIGSGTLAFLLRNGHPDAAHQFAAAIANRDLRQRLEQLYAPSFAVGLALSDYSPTHAQAAFDAMLAQPVAAYEMGLLRALLARVLYSGDTALAGKLVESASRIQPAPGFGQSVAGIRLELLRCVRRETAMLPFYHRITETLVAHCAPTEEDRRTAQLLSSPLALKQAFTHQQRARVITVIFTDNLFTETNRADLIEALGSATSVVGRGKVLGPALDHIIHTAAELDDPSLAQWTASGHLLSDYDVPEVREKLVQDIQTCLARADVKAGTLAQRALRFRLAMVALRTSTENRPDAIFGSAFGNSMPNEYVQILQFDYLASRQDAAAAAAFVPVIDADKLAEPDLLLHVRRFLTAPAQADELELLRASALEKLAQRAPELWFEANPRRLLATAIQARELEAPAPLPDALFTHVASRQVDDFERAFSELARAVRDRDWRAQQRSADTALAIVPDYYELIYLRGEALFHLGDTARARPDLEIFLKKALESELRPLARRMLDQCK